MVGLTGQRKHLQAGSKLEASWKQAVENATVWRARGDRYQWVCEVLRLERRLVEE